MALIVTQQCHKNSWSTSAHVNVLFLKKATFLLQNRLFLNPFVRTVGPQIIGTKKQQAFSLYTFILKTNREMKQTTHCIYEAWFVLHRMAVSLEKNSSTKSKHAGDMICRLAIFKCTTSSCDGVQISHDSILNLQRKKLQGSES